MPGVAEQPATLARLRRPIQSNCACSSSGAFAAVYELRGSTFLAIAQGVQSIAPFPVVGLRSVLAGTILLGFAQLES